MSISVPIVGGAMATGRRETLVNPTGADQSYSVPNPSVSSLDRTNDQVLDFAESDTFNYGVMGASAGIATGAAAASTVAAGGCAGAAVVSGAAALGTFAVVAGAGMAGGILGAMAGDALFDAVGDDLMTSLGYSRITTEGDAPARKGDAIAHQNKNIGLLGALIGAVAAIAVGVLIVATCGAGLLVLAAAAAMGGFVAGAIAGFASKAGQYGTNKGVILEGSNNVLFEGKPVARTLDIILCSDHPNPPPVIAEGAKTVFVNARNLARIGHRTTCDANINAGCSTIVTTLETSQVAEIKSSVSDGLRWANVLINFLPIPRGNRRSFDRSFAKSRNNIHRITKLGEPVDPTTGDFLQSWPLLNIDASIPIDLTISYRSTNPVQGLFGSHWMDAWSQRLTLAENTVSFINSEGVEIEYHTPDNQVISRHERHPQYMLFGERDQQLRIVDHQQRLVYSFDQAGSGDVRLLSAIEDYNSNSIRFKYDQHNMLSRVEHSDGFSLITQVIQGLLVSVSMQEQTPLLSCQYLRGFLIARESAQHGDMYHEYNDHGHMTRWYDSHETDAFIDYDDRGRVVETQTQSGHYADRFEYDDSQMLTRYSDAQGGVTHVYYDSNQQVTCLIDPANNPTHFEYDIQGNRSRVIYADQQQESYQHSEAGLLLSHTDVRGQSTRYDYNEQGLLQQVDLPQGLSWQYKYTDSGNLRAEIHPSGKRSLYRYGERGKLQRAEHDGREIIYNYDHQWRLSTVQEGEAITRFEYDVLGRLLAVEDSERGFTTYQYSAQHNNPSAIQYPDGSAQHFSYDSERLLNSITDGEGKVTRYQYGAFDLLESITHPDQTKIQFSYDKLTRLTQVTNACGETYQYSYDVAGRLTEEVDFRQIRTRFGYDEMNRCIAKRTADNVLHRYSYNSTGDLSQVEQVQAYHLGNIDNQVLAQTTFAYDKFGQLSKATNADACVELEYNEWGQVIAERINGREVRHQYDGDTQQRQKMRWGEQQVDYQYDPQGLLSQLQIQGHQALHFNHDLLGREILRQQAGFALINQYTSTGLLSAQAAGNWDAGMQEHYQSQRQWSRSTWSPHALHGTQLTRGYRYDKAMNPLEIEDNQGVSHYQYNANDQITQAKHTPNHYQHIPMFDHNGKGQHAQQTGNHDSENGLNETFTYDKNRQISQSKTLEHNDVQKHQQQAGCVTSIGNTQYHYDSCGRLSEKTVLADGFRPKTWRYRWNQENQLIGLCTPEGEQWRYGYDAFGRRVRKLKVVPATKSRGQAIPKLYPKPLSQDINSQDTDSDVISLDHYRDERSNTGYSSTPSQDASATQSQVVGTEFLWSGSQLIEEAPIYADGSIGYDQATQWYYKGSEFTPSVQTSTCSKGTGQRKLLHIVADHLGTPREMMDEQGEIVWRQRHSTWGKTHLLSQGLHAANDEAHCAFVFPGQYEDKESGLHYNRHRYYDPQTAQYLSPDPLGLEGGFYPQSYVHNPNGWIDPLGLAGCSTQLGKNMEASGVSKPKDTAAHHIVPGADRKGVTPAQSVLKKHNIDIDSPENGVFLPTRNNSDSSVPGIEHNGRHPNVYIEAANTRIVNADKIGGKPAVLKELSTMRSELQGAVRSSSWHTVL